MIKTLTILLKKSDENWQAGTILLEAAHYDAAANRLYYGLMQSILAYAQSKDTSFNNTKGKLHQRLYDFILDNRYPKPRPWDTKTVKKAFKNLMVLRVASDYSNSERVAKEELEKSYSSCSLIRDAYSKLG